MYNVIVAGADDSPTAREAVRTAIQLAKLSGARLHLVTAYKPKPVSRSGLPDEFRYSMPSTQEADVLLQGLTALARTEGVDVECHAATADPAEAIVSIADREGADLIVVGNKGMQGTRRVLGSVPNTVAHRATCAVLILPTT